MKKLVAFLPILLMTTALASYSNAQCIGCSQGVAPSFSQPTAAVQSFGTPVYNSTPIYNSTPVVNSTPVYNSAPVFNATPIYGSAPVVNSVPSPVSYSEPIYGSPIASTPIESYPAATPVYSQPMATSYPMASPVVNYPIATGSCCGAVSGGIAGQPIYNSYPSPVVSQGWIPAGTIVDGGTVIGETVVVSTPTTVGETGGDSVSPPTPVADDSAATDGPKEDDGT